MSYHCCSVRSHRKEREQGPAPDFDSYSLLVARCSLLWLCGPLLGVLDPAVVDADERFDQALADLADLAEGQAALVELAVVEPLLDQLADQALDPGRGRLREGPAGALDGVGDHQDARLLGLRLGA